MISPSILSTSIEAEDKSKEHHGSIENNKHNITEETHSKNGLNLS